MNIQLKQWILLLLCCGAFAACGDDDDEGRMPVLDLNMDAVMFLQQASEKTVIVTATQDWTATVPADAGWCTLHPAADKLAIAVEANDGTEPRETTLTVQSGNLRRTIEVKQAGTDPFIGVTVTPGQANVSMTEDAGVKVAYNTPELLLDVTANVPYELEMEEGVDWMRPMADIDGQQLEATIGFSLEENSLERDKQTTLTFRQANGDYYKCVSVLQRKNLGDSFILDPAWFTVTPMEGAVLFSCAIPSQYTFATLAITYTHPRKGTLTDTFARADIGHAVISDLLRRDGEYTFTVAALNEDGEELSYEPITFTATCEPVQPYTEYTPVKIPLTVDNVIEGRETYDSGHGFGNMLDGDLTTYYESINQDKPATVTYVIELPEGYRDIEAFEVRTTQRENQPSQAPIKFQFFTSADNAAWSDTPAFVSDAEPGDPLFDVPNYTTGTIDTNQPFSYIKWVLSDRNMPDRTNWYFDLAEFELYKLDKATRDPENETD